MVSDVASGLPLDAARFMGFVPISDADAARRFYVDTLGLRLIEESPFAIVVDANGTMVRLTPVPELRPQPFTIVGFEVTDLDDVVDRLASRGVGFNRYDGVDQDERSIWNTPGGDRVAWFADPDGNTLSLTEFARR
ncbi:MAG TPA: VOC family protein [Acidimicrobiales bacterium]|nr:VOC family protein [Acidimicrobiales bacterium]